MATMKDILKSGHIICEDLVKDRCCYFSRQELPTKTCVTLRHGGRIRIETPGGGGWVSPLERSTTAVKSDVDNGYISARFAQSHFRK